MHHYKKYIYLGFLGLSLLSSACVFSMNTTDMANQTDLKFSRLREEPLLEEMTMARSGAQLEEVIIDQPVINIPEPKAFTEAKSLALTAILGGMACGYGIGGFVIGIGHDTVAGNVLGGVIISGGVAATVGLVKFLHYVKREHAKDLADRASFIPHAQQAILNRRALPYNMNIPDNLMQRVYANSKAGRKESLVDLICALDAKFDWTPDTQETKFNDFVEQANVIVATLPQPIEDAQLEEELQLPIQRGQVREILTYAQSNNNMKALIAHYPLQFVNRYYHNNCPQEKKGYFAEAMAISAAEVHSNNILSLVHPELLPQFDKRTLLIKARNAYFSSITLLN